jgi:hypothetical protein
MSAAVDMPDHAAAQAATAAADKRFANARAELALRGFTLQVVSGADRRAEYEVGRWGASKTLPDMDAVEAFARRVGVA